jgi:hypothetical protein
MLIFTHSLAWYFSKAYVLRNVVGEIMTKKDLEEALSLYCEMRKHDRHPLEDIRKWWREEQKRKRKDCKSREMFLFTKQDNRVWQILFATYGHNFLNVYAYAQRKGKLPFGDRKYLGRALRDYANYLADCLPDCEGVLIEISEPVSSRHRCFVKMVADLDMSLEVVTSSFLLPNFEGKRGREAEANATLYYAARPGKKKLEDHETPADYVRFLIQKMYEIYEESYPDDSEWLSYIAGLKGRVLAAHQQAVAPATQQC